MAAAGLVKDGEVVVSFMPNQLLGHAELVEVRMIAMATTEPFQHVVAVLGEEGVEGAGIRFRLYDNDGEERKEGGGRLVSTPRSWLARLTASCMRWWTEVWYCILERWRVPGPGG